MEWAILFTKRDEEKTQVTHERKFDKRSESNTQFSEQENSSKKKCRKTKTFTQGNEKIIFLNSYFSASEHQNDIGIACVCDREGEIGTTKVE